MSTLKSTVTLLSVSLFLLVAPARASAAPACTIVVDQATGDTIARSGDACETRSSPASTFKVALSLMGFDVRILEDAHAPAWPYRDEYGAWRESWKQITDPTRWLAESVVWYSQVLTRTLGIERFKKYVDAFDYGNRDISGDPGRNNGLTRAWLSSSLKISPDEQTAFVRRLLSGRIPVSPRAREMTMAIMPRFASGDGWTVYGKTGSGDTHDPAIDERQFGWFVGWAQKGKSLVAFARYIEDDTRVEEPAGFRARSSFLADAPALLRGVR